MTNKTIFKYLGNILLLLGISFCFVSCKDFIFDRIVIPEDNPLEKKETPRSGADIYYGEDGKPIPVTKNTDIPNPDSNGAFADWYTCLIMFKEGHPHGEGKMHGNYVYTKAPWKQEEFVEIHNTPNGIKVELDKKSISTFWEQQQKVEDPDYLRIIGGPTKLWGACLYFYDKSGKLLNDSILKHSDQYQIFFSISDVDDKNQPYDILDVRYDPQKDEPTDPTIIKPIKGQKAKGFEDAMDFETRRQLTPRIFQYTYRDTWTQRDMADGRRLLFNIKLLPPLRPADMYRASVQDQDCVGLKGHFMFDFDPVLGGFDPKEWPVRLKQKEGAGYEIKYNRQTYLLPKFYLAIRVMKCEKGKKAIIPTNTNLENDEPALGKFRCAPFNDPNKKSEWREIIRFNIPIKVFTSTYDSDPTNVNPMEPYYFHLGREIGLSPEEAFDAANSNIVHSSDGSGGLGYGAWFL